MSYELKIDPKKRAAGRFIGTVRKALILAAIEEKEKNGLTQQKVAQCLGVNRSVINRMLRGEENLTLRSVAELAWAMGWEPDFRLSPKAADRGNSPSELAPHQSITQSSIASLPPVTTSNTPGNYNYGRSAIDRTAAATTPAPTLKQASQRIPVHA